MTARYWKAALALSMLLSFASPARAEGETHDGVAVKLTLNHAGPSQAEIEQAITRELGVPIQLGATSGPRIEIQVTGRHAAVTYYAPGSASVTRRIDLPPDSERASVAIAFLVGNLARDQAGELLASLRPKQAETGEPEKPAEPAKPAEPEKPAAEPAKPPEPEKPAEPAKPAEPEKPPALKPKTPVAASAAADAEPELPSAPGNLSFYYPITLLPHTERLRLRGELGFAYSRVGAIDGGAFTIGYLQVDQAAHGGLMAAGVLRTHALEGAALAGFAAIGNGRLHGAEIAGLVDWRSGLVRGTQAAGLFSYAQEVEGVQGAGLFSYTHRLRGIQIGGLATLTGKLDGMQVGLVDIAKQLNGVQVGLVNVGGQVHGLQLGLVNVSKELHGGALGLVNVAGNGHVQPTVWVSGPDGSLNVGVKFVTDYTYVLGGVGSTSSGDRFRGEAGLGAHLALGSVYGELGASYAEALSRVGNQLHTDRRELRPRVTSGVRVLPWLEPFAGAGVVTRITGSGADVAGEYFGGLSFL